MDNYLEKGDTIVVTAAADTASGAFVLVGSLGGVAVTDAAAGEDLVLKRKGVFELSKATGAAWNQGDALYWDATNKVFTKTSTDNTAFGAAFAAAASGDAVGSVVLD